MLSTICDKCGKAIPFVKKKNFLGIEEYVLDRGTVRSVEWRIDKLFDYSDFCKDCAEKMSIQLDNLFLRLKLGSSKGRIEE